MSEELVQPEVAAPVEAPAPKPKQYLLMIDEINVAILSRLIPSIQFVQVEGIHMQNNDTHMALVSPMVKLVSQPMPVQPKVN